MSCTRPVEYPWKCFPLNVQAGSASSIPSPLQNMHALHLSVIQVQSCYGLSLGKPGYAQSASRGHESEEQAAWKIWQAESWKISSAKVQRYPQASGSYQNTHVQQHYPLKRHQLDYSLCSVTLLLGEKWNYATNELSHSPNAKSWLGIIAHREHYILNTRLPSSYGHHVRYNERGSGQQLVTLKVMSGFLF